MDTSDPEVLKRSWLQLQEARAHLAAMGRTGALGGKLLADDPDRSKMIAEYTRGLNDHIARLNEEDPLPTAFTDWVALRQVEPSFHLPDGDYTPDDILGGQ